MTCKIASCLIIVLVNVYSTLSQTSTSTTETTLSGSRPTYTTYKKTTGPQTTDPLALSVILTVMDEDNQTKIGTKSLQSSIASDVTTYTPVVTSASQTLATKSYSTTTFTAVVPTATNDNETTHSPLTSSRSNSDSITTVEQTTTNDNENTHSPLTSSKLTTSDSTTTVEQTATNDNRTTNDNETTQSQLTSTKLTMTTSDSQTTNVTLGVLMTSSSDVTTNRIESTPPTYGSTTPTGTEPYCRYTIFNFNTSPKETTKTLERQLKEAYKRSFLKTEVSVSFDDKNCRKSCQKFICHICPLNTSESDNVMLIALVNGITIIENTSIVFKSISIIDNNKDESDVIMHILIGCLSASVIILFVVCVVTKRKYSENNIMNTNKKKKAKTQRMKKMTLKHINGFSRKFFNTKYNDNYDEEQHLEQYECSERPKLDPPARDDIENGLTNHGLAEDLEPTNAKVSEASFNTNEQEQSIEQSDETPPTPIERPLETFPLPVEKNVYVDLTETTGDPIYVNKSAEIMRPGRPGT